jgi:hypothetical protein
MVNSKTRKGFSFRGSAKAANDYSFAFVTYRVMESKSIQLLAKCHSYFIRYSGNPFGKSYKLWYLAS